jgi:hypothetical protein
VIALITEWKDADGTVKTRDEKSDLGGTMRLGAQSSDVTPGHAGPQHLRRRGHRAPPPSLRSQRQLPRRAAQAGLVISALTQREHLTEIVELPQDVHPWFMGVQFHPEFKSTPWGGHPLFNAFIKAALDHQARAAQRPEGGRMKLCGFDIGLDQPFFLIAGPCVVESEQLQMDVAGTLKEITSALGIPFIFKSSFDKANRSSGTSFRGPGMRQGPGDPGQGEARPRPARC